MFCLCIYHRTQIWSIHLCMKACRHAITICLLRDLEGCIYNDALNIQTSLSYRGLVIFWPCTCCIFKKNSRWDPGLSYRGGVNHSWHWSIIQISDFLLAPGFTKGITEVFHTKDQLFNNTNINLSKWQSSMYFCERKCITIWTDIII